MSLKNEQKVMKELDDLMYSSKKITKKPIMTRAQYMKWEQGLPNNQNKKGENMTKETKTKPVAKKEAAVKKEKVLKPYQQKAFLEKNYPAKSAGQIAREQNVSRAAVLAQLRKHRIKISTRTSNKTGLANFKKDVDRSFHKKEFLEAKLKNGLNVYQIAILCGTTHGQVTYFIKKHDLMATVEGMRTKKAVIAKPVKKAKAKKKGDLKQVKEKIKQHKK